MVYIAVNLPVSDLERAKSFYTALGTTINPMFTDENAACVVWDESTNFMLLTREYFATFTDKPVADAKESAQVAIAIGRDSRDDVDAIVEAGAAAGGVELGDATDHGFMYQRSLEDPDGHVLEFLWMDPKAIEQGPEAAAAEQAQA